MDSIKAFFKDRGLYLFCLALVFGVTAGGILGIRSALRGLVEGSGATRLEEGTAWEQPQAPVNDPVTDLPQTEPRPSAQPSAAPSPSAVPSAAPSQPTGGQGASAPSAASSAQRPVSPVDGAETGAAFSGDELVYHATLGDWRTHNGADYTAKAGATVRAVRNGSVAAVYEDALWGTVVEVSDADGGIWRYCGLQESAVQRSALVNAGQSLGTLAVAPPAEADAGAHLHLEYTRDGAYLDPAA